MVVNDLSGQVGLDVTQFRKNIADMGRGLRVVQSEWQANAAAMGKWTDDVGGVETRLGALNKSIPLHESKVATLTDRYEQLAAEQGENSSAAQNMLIKVNAATKALNAAQRESEELTGRLGDLREAQDDSGDESDTLKGKLSKLVGGIKVLGRGLVSVTRLTAPLIGKLKDLGQTAVSATGKLIKSTAQAAKTIAVNLAKIGAAVVVGLAALTATTIGPASDLNETISKTTVVFGDAAQSVLDFGSNSAAALGMSENAALGAAATYGNLLRATGLNEEASAEMSTNLVQLAADLASFNNIDPTEALDKLRAGLTGETEPLKTLGINMSQARLQAKALELGLIEQGEALDAGAKAQAAYAIMVEDTALAQGDFERTSGGLANQQRIMAANFENLRAKIGAGVLPVVTALATKFNDFLARSDVAAAIATIADKFAALGSAIGGLLDGTGSLDQVKALVFNLFKTIGDLFGGGEGALGDFNLGEMIGKMLSGVGKLNFAGIAIDILSGIVDGLVENLPLLAPAAIELLNKIVEFITTGLPVLIETAIPLVLALLDGIVAALPLIIDAADRILTALITGLVAALPQLIPAAIQAIKTLATGLISNLPLLFSAAIEIIVALITGLASMLPELIPVIVEAILTIVQTIAENLPLILEAAVQIILALVDGLVTMLPELIPVMVQTLVTLVTALIDNLPLLIDAALQLIMALALGIVAALPILIKAVPEIIVALIDTLIAALPQIAETAGELIATLALGIIAAVPGIIDAAIQVLIALYNAFGPEATLENLKAIGTGLVEGIWKGIKGAEEWFMKQITSFFTGLIDTVKNALGIGSPSKLFADEVGVNIPPGVGAGIKRAMPRLRRDLAAAMSGLADISGPTLAGANAGAFGAASNQRTEIHISMPLQVYGNADPGKVRLAANEGVLRALRSAGVT